MVVLAVTRFIRIGWRGCCGISGQYELSIHHVDLLSSALVITVYRQALTIRIDADVLDWLRAQGPGYQTRINRLLRRYMQASRVESAKTIL